MSSDKEKLIAELKRRIQNVEPIPEEPDFALSEETLARYLKSRDWKIDEAERLLKDTMEYRRQTRPLHSDCSWCHERPGYHSMRQVGFDEVGRPVLYSNFAQAATHRNTAEDTICHVIYLIENAKMTMKPGISTWVFIIDCTGMTLNSCNPKLGYGVTQVLATHYPERLGMVLCINHSPVFHGVWKAIKVFLHQNTVAKMKLIRSKRKIVQTFSKYFSDELSDWLLGEIKANKQRPLPKSQACFWNGPSDKGSHDPRGCPSYVAQFIDTFSVNSRRSMKRVHKPHPNIVDSLSGEVAVVEASPDEIRERTRAQAEADVCSDSEDEVQDGADDLKISAEFQIPQDAIPLST